MKKLPGIFNNVIGPIMRGPSSSHTAASWRIARTCLDILNEPLKSALIDFDRKGAWAANFREQGTTLGIEGGLMGIEITDDRIKNSKAIAREKGITIGYEINSFATKHPNTMRLFLSGIHGKKIKIVAASLGGGSFEIQKIDNEIISITGDSYVLLVWLNNNPVSLESIETIIPGNSSIQNQYGCKKFIPVKSPVPFTREEIDKLKSIPEIQNVAEIKPVMPIVAGNETKLPFTGISSAIHFAEKENLDLGDLGLIYEKCQSGLPKHELYKSMQNIIGTVEKSISTGLKGTKYDDRILHQQSHLISLAANQGKILRNRLVNEIITNVTAIMETKSAMEVIVANPTAGSCGTVGGVLTAVAGELNSTGDEKIKAYFAAGIAGAYFAQGPGFSAEEHGCQVECGAAGAMAAAGIVQLLGGNAKQAFDAASIALQNSLGLICDPVADRVEVPCLGKNIAAAMNALSAATMACAGFNAVIPYNEVIETVDNVSAQMPPCVKCTGMGGLAITATSKKIKKNFQSSL